MRDISIKISQVDDEEERHDDAIPRTSHIFDGERYEDKLTRNEIMLTTYCRQKLYVVLLIEHDVMVRPGTSKGRVRRHKSIERRYWRRMISVIDATLDFLRAFCGFNKQEIAHKLLSYHRRSMEAIYEMLKAIMEVLNTRSTRNIRKMNGDTASNFQSNKKACK